MVFQKGSPEEAGMLPDKVKYFEELVSSWVQNGVSQAYSFVVARKGMLVSHKAFGTMAPSKSSPPITAETIFPLASLTKPITATAAMILVDDGLLSLSFPVSYYIPEFIGENKNKVYVHHLMTHTSGLRDEDVMEHSKKKESSMAIPAPEPTQHPEIHKELYLGFDTPLWKLPGVEMSYCSYGIELLGEIVRRVSGVSLAQFAKERIFEPLGMKDTYFIVPESLSKRIIIRPEQAPIADRANTPESLAIPSAAGGAYSTPMDMAIFGQMFLNQGKYGGERILSPAAVYEMTRNQVPRISSTYGEEYFQEASFGYCWSIKGNKKDNSDLCSPQSYNHGGAGGVTLNIDPVYETVQVLFSVSMKFNDGKNLWYPECYLFNNAVIAAIGSQP